MYSEVQNTVSVSRRNDEAAAHQRTNAVGELAQFAQVVVDVALELRKAAHFPIDERAVALLERLHVVANKVRHPESVPRRLRRVRRTDALHTGHTRLMQERLMKTHTVHVCNARVLLFKSAYTKGLLNKLLFITTKSQKTSR